MLGSLQSWGCCEIGFPRTFVSLGYWGLSDIGVPSMLTFEVEVPFMLAVGVL